MLSTLLALLCAAPGARAAVFHNPNGPFGSPKVAGLLMTQAIPAYPLKGGVWTLTVAPAYFTNKNESDGSFGSPMSDKRDIAGFGGALSATYGFGPHLGLGVTGAYLKGTGDSGLAMECPNSGCSGPGTYTFGKGELIGKIASAYVILDPFKDPEGFRLPVMLGLGIFDLNETGEYSNASASVKASRRFTGVLPAFGLSPQFNVTRFFRVAPFVFHISKSDPQETCEKTGSGTCSSQEIVAKEIVAMGVQVTYKPWNFSVLIQGPDSCDGSGSNCNKNTSYALRWQRSFGGD